MDASRRLRLEAARKHLRLLLAQSKAKEPRPPLVALLLLLLPVCLALLGLLCGKHTLATHAREPPESLLRARPTFLEASSEAEAARRFDEVVQQLPASLAPHLGTSSEDDVRDAASQDPTQGLRASALTSGGDGDGARGAPRAPPAPAQPRPRLAFLFLTRIVPPLLPLWERFFAVRALPPGSHLTLACMQTRTPHNCWYTKHFSAHPSSLVIRAEILL